MTFLSSFYLMLLSTCILLCANKHGWMDGWKYCKTRIRVSPDEIQHDHTLPWQPSSVFLASDQSLDSVCPGLPEPLSRSELAAADQCLKFCDDKPSAATLPTLSNLRDLNSDCLVAASFLVQWTQAHWNAGIGLSDSVVWTVSRCSVLLDHEVVVRVTANCRQLFEYVLTVINTS